MPAAPEEMHATTSHPKLRLDLLGPAQPEVVLAGTQVEGRLELECKESGEKGMMLGEITVHCHGVEELTSRTHSASESVLAPLPILFQGRSLPPSNAVVPHLPPSCNLPPNYLSADHFPARKGRTTFPFRFAIPPICPSSVSFADSVAHLRYELTARVAVLWRGERAIVIARRTFEVVERWDEEDDDGDRRGSTEGMDEAKIGVLAGKERVYLEAKIPERLVLAGGKVGVEVVVKNNSSTNLSSLHLTLLRRLTIPAHDLPAPAMLITENVSTSHARGQLFEFPAHQTSRCWVEIDVPPTLRSVSSVGGRKRLFHVAVALGIKLDMGIFGNECRVELPLEVLHPLSVEHVPSLRALPVHRPPALHDVYHNVWATPTPAPDLQQYQLWNAPPPTPAPSLPPPLSPYSPQAPEYILFDTAADTIRMPPSWAQPQPAWPHPPSLRPASAMSVHRPASAMYAPSQVQRPASAMSHAPQPLYHRPASAMSRAAPQPPPRPTSSMSAVSPHFAPPFSPLHQLADAPPPRVESAFQPAAAHARQRSNSAPQAGSDFAPLLPSSPLERASGFARMDAALEAIVSGTPVPVFSPASTPQPQASRRSSFPLPPPTTTSRRTPDFSNRPRSGFTPSPHVPSPMPSQLVEPGPAVHEPLGLQTIGEDGESQAGTIREPIALSGTLHRDALAEGEKSVKLLEDLALEQTAEETERALSASGIPPPQANKTLPSPPVPSAKFGAPFKPPRAHEIFPTSLPKPTSPPPTTAPRPQQPPKAASPPASPLRDREGGLTVLEQRLRAKSPPLLSPSARSPALTSIASLSRASPSKQTTPSPDQRTTPAASPSTAPATPPSPRTVAPRESTTGAKPSDLAPPPRSATVRHELSAAPTPTPAEPQRATPSSPDTSRRRSAPSTSSTLPATPQPAERNERRLSLAEDKKKTDRQSVAVADEKDKKDRRLSAPGFEEIKSAAVGRVQAWLSGTVLQPPDAGAPSELVREREAKPIERRTRDRPAAEGDRPTPTRHAPMSPEPAESPRDVRKNAASPCQLDSHSIPIGSPRTLASASSAKVSWPAPRSTSPPAKPTSPSPTSPRPDAQSTAELLSPPPRVKKQLREFPPPVNSSDAGPKYDVRSARGGRGGIVTSVTSLWTQTIEGEAQTAKQPAKPTPKKTRQSAPPALSKPPALLKMATSRSSASGPASATHDSASKSTSAPAFLNTTLPRAHLSSTGTLAGPPKKEAATPTPRRVSAPTKGATSPPPGKVTDVSFGQARLEQLIRQYANPTA